MIQFMPVLKESDKGKSKPHVFTIYHKWDADITKGRMVSAHCLFFSHIVLHAIL